VVVCNAESGNGIPVFPGRIPFVLAPAVIWVIGMDFLHVIIPEGLGKDGGCRNAHVTAIAFDKAGVLDVIKDLETVPVDQYMLGSNL
jgi:hypothetical protein